MNILDSFSELTLDMKFVFEYKEKQNRKIVLICSSDLQNGLKYIKKTFISLFSLKALYHRAFLGKTNVKPK